MVFDSYPKPAFNALVIPYCHIDSIEKVRGWVGYLFGLLVLSPHCVQTGKTTIQLRPAAGKVFWF
jgi:hypothetical protein